MAPQKGRSSKKNKVKRFSKVQSHDQFDATNLIKRSEAFFRKKLKENFTEL